MTEETIESLLRQGKEFLRIAGIDNYPLDARLLLQFVLNARQEDLITAGQKPVEKAEQRLYLKFLKMRGEGAPISKIIGRREFYGHNFTINNDVLDPRPETEHMVDSAIQFVQASKKLKPIVLELGVGSGAPLISVLKACDNASGIGVDLSFKAIKIAQRNAKDLLVDDRCVFINGSWGNSLSIKADILMVNPPYIRSKEIESLDREVKNHDPILALDGGNDGLDAYKIIFSQLNRLIHPQGKAIVEIGHDQLNDIQRIVKDYRVAIDTVVKDLSGFNRVVILSTRKN